MNPGLEKTHDYFIETVARLCKGMGLSEIAGQLYALLYLSAVPISLNEMVERLKISKGSASVNIRALEGWGAAKRVWVKGNRRDHYVADTDIWKIVTNRLKLGLERRITEASGAVEQVEKMLQDSQEKMNSNDKKVARVYMQRIKAVKQLTGRLENLLKFLPTDL